MTSRFLKCLVVVALIHLFAAVLVFGAYYFTKTSDHPPDTTEYVLSGNSNVEPEPDPPREHVVQRGESYDSIARKYQTSIQALREANGHTPKHVLQPGERLTIPNE